MREYLDRRAAWLAVLFAALYLPGVFLPSGLLAALALAGAAIILPVYGCATWHCAAWYTRNNRVLGSQVILWAAIAGLVVLFTMAWARYPATPARAAPYNDLVNTWKCVAGFMIVVVVLVYLVHTKVRYFLSGSLLAAALVLVPVAGLCVFPAWAIYQGYLASGTAGRRRSDQYVRTGFI